MVKYLTELQDGAGRGDVASFRLLGGRWWLDFLWLGSSFRRHVRFVRLREPACR